MLSLSSKEDGLYLALCKKQVPGLAAILVAQFDHWLSLINVPYARQDTAQVRSFSDLII